MDNGCPLKQEWALLKLFYDTNYQGYSISNRKSEWAYESKEIELLFKTKTNITCKQSLYPDG